MIKKYYYKSFNMPDDYFGLSEEELQSDDYKKRRQEFDVYMKNLQEEIELKKRNKIRLLNPLRIKRLNSIIHNAYNLAKQWYGDICVRYDEENFNFYIDVKMSSLHINDDSEKPVLIALINDADHMDIDTDYENGNLQILMEISIVEEFDRNSFD